MQTASDILQKCLVILSPYRSQAKEYLKELEQQTLNPEQVLHLLDLIQQTLKDVTNVQHREQAEKLHQQLKDIIAQSERELATSDQEADLLLTQLDG